jgi:hypothetical protein
MKIRSVVLTLAVGTLALAAQAAAAPPAGPCTMPTAASGTTAETAWRLFVAANCPGSGTQMVWESWTEQDQVYPASGKVGKLAAGKTRRLHGSPLAHAQMARKAGLTAQLTPSTECNPMGGPPSNVVPGATICEEARLNPAAKLFVFSKGYEVRSGQTKAAQAGTDIQFPTAAVEVKVDWVPATDFQTPFTCAKPPAGVHVETIDGVCYAMAGMHIASKLKPDWIWATFEPQNLQTNPNRCITFGACDDPWGSVPATSNGGQAGFTKLSPALEVLMKSAKLAPEFLNYRMDGVQTEFGTASNPTLLGNSIIEGENVGMTAGTASCITCHSVSTIENNGTDGITLLNNQVGPQYVPLAGWIARDFVWSLALACPGGIQNCSSTPAAVKDPRKKGKPAAR